MRLFLGWLPIVFFAMASYRKAQLTEYLQETIQYIAMSIFDTALLVFFVLPIFLIFAGAFEYVMKRRPVWEVLSFPLIALIFFPAAPWVDLFGDPQFLIIGGLFILTFNIFFRQVTRAGINMGPYPAYYKNQIFGFYAPKSVDDFIKPRMHFFAFVLVAIILKITWLIKAGADKI